MRDPESGRLLPHGESGEIEVSGPSLMAGYFGDDEATSRAITDDDWLRAGDLGRLVGGGSFVFETRMGDVLRLSGYLVAPLARFLRTTAAPKTRLMLGTGRL